MELRKRIDAAATKVILDSNFTDLTKLANEKHCNRLVKKVASIFQQNKDTVDLEMLRQKLYSQQKKEEIMENGDTEYGEKHKLKIKTPRFQNVEKKCMQISKFYVLFAHLFSCIVSTIDPSFKMTSNVKEKTPTTSKSSSNNEKDEKDASSSSLDFCSSRIDALVNGELNENSDGDFLVKPNVCKTNVSKSGNALHLIDLPGMKALQQLYNDVNDGSETNDARYLYTAFTGKDAPDDIRRLDQIPLKVYNNDEECKEQKSSYYGGETKEEAEKREDRRDKERRELEKERMFYHYYNERDRKKNEEENARSGIYLKGVVGSLKEQLFSEYVQHIKEMIQRAESNRSNLLEILSEMFTYTYGDGRTISGVIINPALTYKNLQSLVARTRRIIIKLYTDCEEDYKHGLDIFFAMVQEKIILKLSVQEEVLKKQLEDVMYGPPERYIPESLLYQQQYQGAEEFNKKQFVPPHFKSSVISIVKKSVSDDVFKLALPELNAWINEEMENATSLLNPNEVASEFLKVYDYGDNEEGDNSTTLSSSAPVYSSNVTASPVAVPSAPPTAPVRPTVSVPASVAKSGPYISPSPRKVKRTYDIKPKNLMDVIDE
ncbi:MAG: hypothetical protein EBS55_11310 [Flavobacteriaceae bacterium]|nr:hypothetical protein [Flavobacteriaceae bacterium]